MTVPIRITVGDTVLEAELNETLGARGLLESLPMTLNLSRWGDEYYGGCGLSLEDDGSSRDILDVGEIAFWPPGSALCLFFGPTPASTDDRPRAASAVIPLGRFTDDPSPLKGMGASIRASLARKGEEEPKAPRG